MDADLRLEPVAGGRSEAKPPSHAPAAIFGQRPRIGYRAALPGSTASKLFFNRDRASRWGWTASTAAGRCS